MNTTTEKLEEIKLPFDGTIILSVLNTRSNSCTIGITSNIRPFEDFEYDAEHNTFSPGIFNKPANYPAAYNELVCDEAEVRGHDGVMIPLSIVHKKGLKLDGSNVCSMEGYGAYGISATPFFDTRTATLAIKGVVIAIPHIRGGSEKGAGLVAQQPLRLSH